MRARGKNKFLFLIMGFFLYLNIFGINMGELSEGNAGIFLDVSKASVFGNPAGAVFATKWGLGYGMAMENSQGFSANEHDVYIIQPFLNGFAGFMKLILRNDFGVLNNEEIDEKIIGFSYSAASFIFNKTAIGLTLNLYRLNSLEGKVYAFDTDIGFLAPIGRDLYFSGTVKGLLGWANAQNPMLPNPMTIGVGFVANSQNGSLYFGSRFGGNLTNMEDSYFTLGGRITRQPVDIGLYTDIKYSINGNSENVYELFKNLISDVYIGGKFGISISGINVGIVGKFGTNELQTKGLASVLTARGGIYISVDW